jgi:hypothetical protein
MKLFVIHRFKDRKRAKSRLKKLAQKSLLEFQLVFLDSSGGEQWKSDALHAIDESEAIVIFNRSACEESENAKWEIEKAEDSGKEIVEITAHEEDKESSEKLKLLYDLKDELDACFSSSDKDTLELYKIMLESSEKLF